MKEVSRPRSIDPRLRRRLQEVSDRQRRLRLWLRIGCCWAGAALVGGVLISVQRQTGWASALAIPAVASLAILASLICVSRDRRSAPDWAGLAQRIEGRHQDLDGRLLTSIELDYSGDENLGYLEDRLVQEAVAHAQTHDWPEAVPRRWLSFAQAGHWLSLLALLSVCWGLRTTRSHSWLGDASGWVADTGVSVTPGDVTLERGANLVVLARFGATLPAAVELVLETSPESRRVALSKSLADPIFGGSVADITNSVKYHVEYSGKRTRDFQVTVFEFPRLERADADLRFPDYTGQPSKRIENTRRISAVEDSRLDLALKLNKPVVSAQLIPREKASGPVVLQVETNQAEALLRDFPLVKSARYSLALVDSEGRTNKVPAEFVFDVSTNRVPELRLTSPRGDVRPTPIEEITFEGTVWDDFGVQAFGVAYTLSGDNPHYIELGGTIPAREKRPFKHILRLEELGLRADSLVAWFVWADDVGPDGQVRRTSGDLFFGEIRPFEEVFREGQPQDGGGQGGAGGQQGDPASKLAELQKQIISATWKLQRQSSPPGRPKAKGQTRTFPGQLAPVIGSVSTPDKASIESRASQPSSAAIPPPAGFGRFAGQISRDESSRRVDPVPLRPRRGSSTPGTNQEPTLASDVGVVRDAQAQALEQAEEASQRQDDPRTTALWSAAKEEMQKALARLEKATNSAAAFADALAAEQAAYQSLLRLQQHEYQVRRSQSRGQGGGKEGQMQRQLEQMEMTQAENRYETQRQAQAPQNQERREQLQVQNRLQELARRQQDLNDRLKELQTALQEARTEQERQEAERRLKRLQEEEQQMLADVDELRQRMERSENQSQMAEQRQQLDQTREDVQRAADAAAQGSASQALASGTRAQRQLQQIRDQMRKENSNQFAEDLRDMRGQARELSRKQEDLLKQMQPENSGPRRLAETTDRKELLEALNRQMKAATNLVERASEVSRQAEESEPLLSRQLYDTVRNFNQDTAKGVKESQQDLLNRGLLTESLYQHLKDPAVPESTRLLDLTSELLQSGMVPQAAEAGQRAREGLENMKRGIEHAAESVLGDDTEALRLAQQELDRIMEQLQREMAGATGAATNSPDSRPARGGGRQGAGTNLVANAGENPGTAGENQPGGRSDRPGEPQPDAQAGAQGQENAQSSSAQTAATGQGQSGGRGQRGGNNRDGANQTPGEQDPGARGDTAGAGLANRSVSDASRAVRGGASEGGGNGPMNFERLLEEGGGPQTGPLTGGSFVPWSDSLRNVEEMIESPELRNQVAMARDRARLLRQAYRRELKKPDWTVVRLQIVKPLVEVRDQIAEELARRGSNEALVPIDRDPVPSRYSELVRRYYEELGKDKAH